MSNVCTATLIPKIFGGFVLGCCLGFIPSVVPSATANSATLQWAANSESDLKGYMVYQGTTAGAYGPSIDAGIGTTYIVSNLRSGLTYYFAVTAYDTSGNESPPSHEVSKFTPDSSPDLTPPSRSLTSPTNGMTISGLVPKHEIIDLVKDLKLTTPPTEPRTSSTTVNRSQQSVIDTGNDVIVQPTEIIRSRGPKGDQTKTAFERNIQVLEMGKPFVRRTIP